MKKSWFGILALAVFGAACFENGYAQDKLGLREDGRAVARGVVKVQTQNPNYGMEAQAKPDKIDNDSSTERVEVTLDRADLTYHEGETGEITVRSSVDGYLYLVNFDVQGNATLLFPNEWNQNNRIKAGSVTTYPAKDQNFVLRIVGPTFGEEKVRAFVTREEIDAFKGIKYGENATNVNAVLGKLEKELQERVQKDYQTGTKGFVAEKKNEKREIEVTIGQCVYYTKKGERPVGGPVTKEPRRVFVGFGVNEYLDSRVRRLKCCVADVKAMGDLAGSSLGVAEKDCLVLTDKEVTLAAVREIFTEILPEYTRPGDEIFVYWSGHGDKAASGVTRANDAFLVPCDAKVNDRTTMLGEHEFGLWLKDNLQGRKIVLFLDACHSGGMLLEGGKSLQNSSDEGAKGGLIGRWQGAKTLSDADFQFDFGVGVGDASAKSLGHVGMFAMASSGEDEVSWEGSGSLGLSVATHFLIETIKKGDSSLSHKDLVKVIRPKVAEYVGKNRRNAKQTVVSYDGVKEPVKLIRK